MLLYLMIMIISIIISSIVILCIAYLGMKFITSKVMLVILLPIKRKTLKNRMFKSIILANLNNISNEFYYFEMYIDNKNFEDMIFENSKEVENFRKKLYEKIKLNKYINDYELKLLNDIITINYHIY